MSKPRIRLNLLLFCLYDINITYDVRTANNNQKKKSENDFDEPICAA